MSKITSRLSSLLDPRFVFRPDMFVRAIIRKVQARPDTAVVATAWGDLLRVNPRQHIGAQLYMRGVHELIVCETLWRLAEEGELAADIGANIGVMSSVLSRKVGRQGKVFAFEAHPRIAERLSSNARLWARENVEVRNCALSSQAGILGLEDIDDMGGNEGVARVVKDRTESGGEARLVQVPARTLDGELEGLKCGIWKIDVEGHEEEVLKGAVTCLERKQARDIVFEGDSRYPSPAHLYLESHGYRCFRLAGSLFGPNVVDPAVPLPEPWPLAEYVATTDADRLVARMRPSGWKVLRRQKE